MCVCVCVCVCVGGGGEKYAVCPSQSHTVEQSFPAAAVRSGIPAVSSSRGASVKPLDNLLTDWEIAARVIRMSLPVRDLTRKAGKADCNVTPSCGQTDFERRSLHGASR